jgi:hypothetical protein
MRTSEVKLAQTAEALPTLMQLRCRKEILEHWLASQVLTDGLQQGLRAMLAEVDDQLHSLATARSS